MRYSYEFSVVCDELNRWQEQGRDAKIWLRDDDAHEPGAQLDRLLAAMRRHHAHCLIAVVPSWTGEPLVERLRSEPLARIAVHGSAHRNNALPGGRAEEMALALGMTTIRDNLANARARLVSLFGDEAGRWYVPPWNRIEDCVAAMLPELGFSAISAFSDRTFGLGSRLLELNTHVDPIDWKRGPVAREALVVAAKLADELAKARGENFRPVGILTHHLVHDEAVWSVLERILEVVSGHPAAGWHDPDTLLEPEGRSV